MHGNQNYMKIGFDNVEARSKKSLLERHKHYRFVINNTLQNYELEKTGTQIGMFDESPIRTGRYYPSNDIASNLLKKFTEMDHYIGKYKGNVFINLQVIALQKKQINLSKVCKLLNNSVKN